MAQSVTTRNRSGARARRPDFWDELKGLSMFFQERDEVHKAMRRLVRRLERADIPYAVMGGMAVFAHGHRRSTNDVDILLTAEGLEQFRKRFVGKNYTQVPARGRRFVDRMNDVTIDVLVTGHFPGRGDPGPIAFPDPATAGETVRKIRVLDLATLIELKLAARRYQDFADVVHLMRANGLDESFAQQLHKSVRADYIECLEEKRREDTYEARRG